MPADRHRFQFSTKSRWGSDLDRSAAVLAVRLLRRVGNYVGLDLLHPATTGQILFHGPCQLFALALLGFDAGQLLELKRFGLGLFLILRHDLAVSAHMVYYYLTIV